MHSVLLINILKPEVKQKVCIVVLCSVIKFCKRNTRWVICYVIQGELQPCITLLTAVVS